MRMHSTVDCCINVFAVAAAAAAVVVRQSMASFGELYLRILND